MTKQKTKLSKSFTWLTTILLVAIVIVLALFYLKPYFDDRSPEMSCPPATDGIRGATNCLVEP